ncbi:MAG: hypothetical protein J6V24_06375 [Clostridia bacterium]|nr:hypothetical protein [Clostridia bacterium]
MTEIVKVFRDPVPAMRFIGKKYADFGGWGEWFANGWFDTVEAAMGGPDKILAVWKNGGGYCGLERRGEGIFEYWIGMFTPAATPVPEGFVYVDFPAGDFGTAWIRGPEEEVHGAIPACAEKLREAGMEFRTDEDGAVWSFENGLCPRFTTPDEEGCVILDYVYIVK